MTHAFAARMPPGLASAYLDDEVLQLRPDYQALLIGIDGVRGCLASTG
jgi:hypothetical protein